MSRVDAAAADRLPWLQDEPQPPRAKRRGRLVPWAAALIVVVGGAGFWVGTRNVQQPAPISRHVAPSTTVALPAPRMAEPVVQIAPEREVAPSPVREVRATPTREVRIAPPAKPLSKENQSSVSDGAKPEVAAPAPTTPAVVVPLRPWNPRLVSGAAGRLVQIGAFGSIHQAKQGWWYMAREYPAMRRLPAVVRPTRNSRGRVFYRFQVGTTSQAHSEILCQRMQRIRFSCAVVGLPWKAKVER